MSQVRANSITNAAGTGAPDFPNGLTGEDVTLAGTVTAGSLRLPATGDAALASIGHALQIGSTASFNLAIDNNELQARNNGAAATLSLNFEGGNITLGQSGGSHLVTINGVVAGDIAADLVPAGMVSYFAGSSAPSGWLKANGASISRTTYATLFSAIGTTFGAGNGSTTFQLPDLRGEFLRSWDDGRGVDSGRAFGSFQNHAMQNHIHGLNANGTTILILGSQSSVVAGATRGGIGVWGESFSYLGNGGGRHVSEPVASTGSGGVNLAGETRPRNIALLACIKF